MNADDVLIVRGVRKTYEAENAPVRALRGADLTMAPGEFVAIMGPSGCGKSTLLNLVAGLDSADEGTITVAGDEVTGRSEDDLARMRRRHIGIVFQFFNLLEGMSVLENVALPAIVAGMKRRQAETRARDLLDLLGLSDKAKAAPGVLSGGQRQRLAIARALANQPTLLLADEPTGALDSDGGHEVMELFRRLHAGGQTILMVTHNDEVAASAERIVNMRDGRVLVADPASADETAVGDLAAAPA
jgi:putative ABC transport system ATP-binding protein